MKKLKKNKMMSKKKREIKGFSQNLKKQKKLIFLCNNLDKSSFTKFMKIADKDFINAISEICDNIIKGNVSLTKTQFVRLKRYHKHLKIIGDKKKSSKIKKKFIQSGGFLPAIIAPLIGFLGTIISSVINRRKK